MRQAYRWNLLSDDILDALGSGQCALPFHESIVRLYEGVPTRQGGHEVVAASPKAISTASPGEGSTSPAVLSGLSAGRRGDNAMTRTYREIALDEMLRNVVEAMRHVTNW